MKTAKSLILITKPRSCKHYKFWRYALVKPDALKALRNDGWRMNDRPLEDLGEAVNRMVDRAVNNGVAVKVGVQDEKTK